MIDIFKNNIVPFIETEFKNMLVLGNEDAKAIADGNTVFSGQDADFTLNFQCSYSGEWLDVISNSVSQGVSPFPALFLNTNNIIQKDRRFEIGELILAVESVSTEELNAEAQREYNINPYLLNLKDLLLEAIEYSFEVDYPFEPAFEIIYTQRVTDDIPQNIDAVLFKNLKIKEIC